MTASERPDLPEVMGYDEYERIVRTFIAGDSL